MIMTDNINKIPTAFRTKGNITGNFNKPKVKAGSSLNDIGDGEVGSLPTKLSYTMRLVSALPLLDDRSRPGIIEQLKHLCATQGLSHTLYSKYL
jgi:hypothetical protein